MKLTEFNYKLPEELIAQYPLKKRDEARLLVVNRKDKSIDHDIFANLYKYLPQKAHFVLNDSKVVAARLFGQKESTGANIELLLLKKHSDGLLYETLMRPMRRLKDGDQIIFKGNGLRAKVVNKDQRIVQMNRRNIQSYLQNKGHVPLPPYIRRKDKPIDRTHYQTVYAKHAGSVAAPTAGLHFTEKQIKSLKKLGYKFHSSTLHVNYGTFKPVEQQDVRKHKMHSEPFTITKKTIDAIKKARKLKEKIIAVGTTSCRVLETVAWTNRSSGETNIFIYPGFKFKWTDVLITNFHLPFSTLLMLVYAFGGTDLMRKAYKEAINNKYRFYSYGDAMIII